MVWKCPKCSYTSSSHAAVQKHYYKQHYKPKVGAKAVNKGKDKKVHVFKPLKRKGR